MLQDSIEALTADTDRSRTESLTHSFWGSVGAIVACYDQKQGAADNDVHDRTEESIMHELATPVAPLTCAQPIRTDAPVSYQPEYYFQGSGSGRSASVLWNVTHGVSTRKGKLLADGGNLSQKNLILLSLLDQKWRNKMRKPSELDATPIIG